MSFLVGLLAMAKFERREHRLGSMAMSVTGAILVAFTLLVNLSRGDPIASLAAASLIAAVLYWSWVRSGRPRGIAESSDRVRVLSPRGRGYSTGMLFERAAGQRTRDRWSARARATT
jgi:hypothetical protein